MATGLFFLTTVKHEKNWRRRGLEFEEGRVYATKV